jgi:hypothetical protein
MNERFRPGGVTHALVSGLVEAALALLLLGGSLLAAERSTGAATSLAVASLLWAVLALYSLAVALLRARVFAAELDDQAVVLHGLGGASRYPYHELSAVEVSRGRTRLVARDGRVRAVRGVRGAVQGNRFRARVLARATEAAGGSGGLKPSPPVDGGSGGLKPSPTVDGGSGRRGPGNPEGVPRSIEPQPGPPGGC